MQNSRSMGRCIHHTPGKAVLGGELVVLTGMVAVASTDIPANEEGACEVEGVFALPKKAGWRGAAKRPPPSAVRPPTHPQAGASARGCPMTSGASCRAGS